ncbi:hypothetical protein GIS00_02435 [Nakamurella sp. YIM 132087]|uniref:META domain-containing protein n=1 Tax=Nakamurella alba TaxID=2665158 RepID=A0A7K1FFB5_9ACTN|nr:hypothetical protein [Nakamurella alba]MTD12802.1 hypothetical protein [Nakamurella alba]
MPKTPTPRPRRTTVQIAVLSVLVVVLAAGGLYLALRPNPLSGDWVLSTATKDGSTVSAPTGYSAVFDSGGEGMVSSGCGNSLTISTTTTFSGSGATVDSVATTLLACDAPTPEDAAVVVAIGTTFAAQSTLTVETVDGELHVGSGGTMLVYSPASD